jgi:hypothetical protein
MPVNPFQFFKAGQSVGAATSPVGGVGDSIRGILDHARKVGLIQTQQNTATAGAIGRDQMKFNRESVDKPVFSVFQDQEGNPGMKDMGSVPYNAQVRNVSGGQSDPMIAAIAAKMFGDDGGQDGGENAEDLETQRLMDEVLKNLEGLL